MKKNELISIGRKIEVKSELDENRGITSGHYYDRVRESLVAATKHPRTEVSDNEMIRRLFKIVADLADDLGVRVEYSVR